VLFTAGVALLFLGFCYGMIEGMQIKKWSTPFLVLGTNAIAAYVGSSLMVKLISLINVTASGEALSLKAYIYNYLLAPWAGQLNGSLLYPLFFILLWVGIMVPLYRKKIIIKI
jgi:predicted acyltransferase